MRPKGILATTVRLIAQNFADNGTINAPKFYRYFLSNFAKFDANAFAQCCKKPNCHYCWKKKKGNVPQVVWSTASLISLIIHSTGWEDISKLTHGPMAATSGVLVRRLSRFCYLFLFTHSCLNNCTDLSRVNTELTVKEDKCCCPFIRDIYITVLAPVVQMFYSAINPINHYPVDKYYLYQQHYPLDRDLSSR